MMPLLTQQLKLPANASEMVQEGVQHMANSQLANSPVIPPMMSPPMTSDQGGKHMQQRAVNEVNECERGDKKKKYRLRGRSSETAKAHRG
eukprot:TRINITY_DN9192_c0_g2_i1.p2 TRINITY_DN9192_c0_g2~~TRINITY_DN9192_c0_g2_i1.p2  ORF type:complete len:90 (-),score=34.16 TRINITY_DN9192_c0_g2_i1:2-271(-)